MAPAGPWSELGVAVPRVRPGERRFLDFRVAGRWAGLAVGSSQHPYIPEAGRQSNSFLTGEHPGTKRDVSPACLPAKSCGMILSSGI